MCVCCSLGSHRRPPVPQSSTGTSCWGNCCKSLWCWPWRFQSLLTESVWSHPCVFSQFGCSEKLLLQFKERNGRPEGEYEHPGWHSSNIWFQSECSAWKSSVSDLLGLLCTWTCTICGDLTDPSVSSSQTLSSLVTDTEAAAPKAALPTVTSCLPREAKFGISGWGMQQPFHSCCWKYPRNTKNHGECPEATEMPFRK